MAGQIVKRGDNVWLVRVFLGRTAEGKREYFSKTFHGTKKDAQKFLTQKLSEKDRGVFVDHGNERLTEYLDRWLADVIKERVSSKTFTSYNWVIDAYLRPQLGGKKLHQIKAPEVQRLYTAMKDRGLSSRTVRYAHTVLSSAMKQAVRWNLLNANPCDLCDLPKATKTEMQYFTPGEVERFLDQAQGEKHSVLFHLAIETGTRPEEYLALQWRDLDLEGRRLSVRRALTRTAGGGFAFTDTKTRSSRRNIPLSKAAVSELRNHRRRQLEDRMRLGEVYQDYDLVFASEIGTPLDLKNLRDRHFKRIRDAAGLPAIRLYDLRHTMATMLLLDGVNPKIVAERLGHSSVVMTLDTYSHVLPTMQDDATDSMARLMSKASFRTVGTL